MSKSPAPVSPPLRATRAALNRPAPPPSSPAPLPCCRRRGLPEARAALQDGSGGTSRSFRGGFRERGSCTKKLRRRVTQRRRGAPNPATRWADPAIPWLDLRGAALHRLGRRRPLRRPVWSSGTADCPARGRGLGRASAVWLRAALAGGVRPLEVVSCGGQRVPGGGVVLQLGRRVVRTVTAAVGCSLCHGGMVGAPAAGTCDFGRKLLQWRCGSAAEMSLDWSGHGGDAGSCAMRVHQGWVALGESPCQLHVGGMATTSLDVVFPVEGVISEL
jgi:hypothetical protein